ncbi:MAG TPA: hemolysin family protein [Bacillota bacterium]|nr:hemolysin family protein [Bacillota bacterium]
MAQDGSFLPQIFLLFVLIGLNAFFAASEIAIISLNAQRVKRRAEEGDHKSQLLMNLMGEPSRFLATIQVGATLAGLLASAVASESFSGKLTAWVIAMGLPLNRSAVKLVSMILITLVLSYFTLVLGELVPKRFAMQKSEKIANFAVKPLSLLSKVAAPFVRLLSMSTNLVIRLLGGDPLAHEERISEEEIRLMVDVGQEKGIIQSTEKEMINNIFEFDNTAISEVMTHRTDVVALPDDADLEDVVDIVVREKFSRIPVYRESMDDIVGILHVQDLIPALNCAEREAFDLKNVMRKPYFVPFTKKTDELFNELQKNNNHMAVVIDEFGGTAGIVTIEDLIEEIVGNIFDEHDEVIKEIEQIDDKTFIAEGTVSLDEIEDLLEIRLPMTGFETLGGFVMSQLGRIPGEHERPSFIYQSVKFQVEALDEKRIAKIKIEKL